MENEQIDLCPKCGANWTVLNEMLAEEPGTDNYVIADRLIRACVVCRDHFLNPIGAKG